MAQIYFQIFFNKDISLYLFQGDLCLAHLRNKHTAAKDQRTKDKLGILSSASPGSTWAHPSYR